MEIRKKGLFFIYFIVVHAVEIAMSLIGALLCITYLNINLF